MHYHVAERLCGVAFAGTAGLSVDSSCSLESVVAIGHSVTDRPWLRPDCGHRGVVQVERHCGERSAQARVGRAARSTGLRID